MYTGVSTKVPGTKHTRVWLGGRLAFSTIATLAVGLFAAMLLALVHVSAPRDNNK